MAEHRTLSRGTGRQFLYIVVDGHSRLACAEVPPSERGCHAVAFLCCAARWYTEHDLAVEQVMTPATALPTSAAAGAQPAANSLLRYLRTRDCTLPCWAAQLGQRLRLPFLCAPRPGPCQLPALVQPLPAPRLARQNSARLPRSSPPWSAQLGPKTL